MSFFEKQSIEDTERVELLQKECMYGGWAFTPFSFLQVIKTLQEKLLLILMFYKTRKIWDYIIPQSKKKKIAFYTCPYNPFGKCILLYSIWGIIHLRPIEIIRIWWVFKDSPIQLTKEPSLLLSENFVSLLSCLNK